MPNQSLLAWIDAIVRAGESVVDMSYRHTVGRSCIVDDLCVVRTALTAFGSDAIFPPTFQENCASGGSNNDRLVAAGKARISW